MKKETREWLAKAEADFVVLPHIALAKTASNDILCFHCQQAVEKYPKGFMVELGQTPPRTHDLPRLATMLAPHFHNIMKFQLRMEKLTHYAVESRYPGHRATARQAKSAVNYCTQIREFVHAWFADRDVRSKSKS